MTLFSEILSLEGVEGSLLFSPEGELLSWSFASSIQAHMDQKNWQSHFPNPGDIAKMIQSFDGMHEIELFFDAKKILIRNISPNYLTVIMNRSASTDMVRLVSDTLIPKLRKVKKTKKTSSFFKAFDF
ncbi:hypothetical protein OOT00_14165 [Desulfobotulus sp. H1]|uniref:Roadblock/LC7 domain-containing protein n=1 Tax=Desulfobotulus pelophilus TaxID=2823377 RepID=A0ABT3NCD8_9BACT|nr:hypothetical protein [Desulfobotulus pelophilus]MCW7755129.1 hypothetical protein [Desulfobotulus pelophilus]